VEKTKLFLSGNEAVAKGSYDSGVKVGVGYPGTPSTEILEAFVKFRDVYTEWSINEKTALEIGIGSSLSGARTLVTMKHVGVNVAADPLFTASYAGVGGGLIIITADDPGMHSSQNEQDNRHYGEFAKVPVLEPADSQEVYDFIDFGLNLSEKYDTPVLFRLTTRIAHTRCIVVPVERDYKRTNFKFERNLTKYVMIPAFARKRHIVMENRMKLLGKDLTKFSLETVRMFYDDAQTAGYTINIT
jgi:indolepyruvate ferredoxin oxidoreductase alpha subunit